MALSEIENDLIKAAKSGDTDLILRLMLTHKINLDIADEDYGCTPLMWAAIEGQSAAALLLIKFGANISKYSKQGRTALHYAAKSGLLDLCKTLVFLSFMAGLFQRLNINRADGLKNSCLHLAAREGHLELVKWLVSVGVNKRAINAEKKTACEIAQSKGYDGVVAFLLNQENKQDFERNSLHLVAAKRGRFPGNVASDAFSQTDLFGCTPFEYACFYGRRDFSSFMRLSVLPSRSVSTVFSLNSLGLACYRGHFSIVKNLWSTCFSDAVEFDINMLDIHDMSIFVMLLIKIRLGELRKNNVDSYKNIRDFFLRNHPAVIDEALAWSIAHKNLPIFQAVIALAIWNSLPIDKNLFEGDLLPEMVVMLTYKSARRGRTIREYLQEYIQLPVKTAAQRKTKRNKQEKLKQIYYDYEDTTDEEASDDEDDSPQMVDSLQQDKLIKPGVSQLVRGTHFCSNRFISHQARRAAREPSYHKNAIYSQATYNLAQRDKLNGEGQIGFDEADKLIQSYFTMLKLTPDKSEAYKYHDHKRSKAFLSLYLRLIHVYVNKHGYDALFNKGEIRYNFNFLSEDNPTLSTTPDFLVAYKYCSGDRIVGNQRIYPKLWRAEGVLKHRRIGYVQVYLVDAAYLREHGADVDALNQAGDISISHNYSFNKEVIIESSIPAEYVFAYQVFSLPSFADNWDDEIKQKYGLNEINYNMYRKQLQGIKEHDYKSVLISIIDEITSYQAGKFQEKIAQWKAEAQAAIDVAP